MITGDFKDKVTVKVEGLQLIFCLVYFLNVLPSIICQLKVHLAKIAKPFFAQQIFVPCLCVMIQDVLGPKLSVALVTGMSQLEFLQFHGKSVHFILVHFSNVVPQGFGFLEPNIAEFAKSGASLRKRALCSSVSVHLVVFQYCCVQKLFVT